MGDLLGPTNTPEDNIRFRNNPKYALGYIDGYLACADALEDDLASANAPEDMEEASEEIEDSDTLMEESEDSEDSEDTESETQSEADRRYILTAGDRTFWACQQS